MKCPCGKDHDPEQTPCLCPSENCRGDCMVVIAGPAGRPGGYLVQYYCSSCKVHGPLCKAATAVEANHDALRGLNGLWSHRHPDPRLEEYRRALRAIIHLHKMAGSGYAKMCADMVSIAGDALYGSESNPEPGKE